MSWRGMSSVVSVVWVLGAWLVLAPTGAAQTPPPCQPGTPGCAVPPPPPPQEAQTGCQPGTPGCAVLPTAVQQPASYGYGQPVAQQPAGQQSSESSTARRGFYFAGSAALGYRGHVAVSDSERVFDFHTMGLTFDLNAGYVPSGGFAFGVQVFNGFGLQFAGEIESSSVSVSTSLRGIGFFVSWFPDDKSGFAAEAGLGVLGGSVSVSESSQDNSWSVGTGSYLHMFLGHEMPLSGKWSMAMGARFRYGVTFNGDLLPGDEASFHQMLQFVTTFRYL